MSMNMDTAGAAAVESWGIFASSGGVLAQAAVFFAGPGAFFSRQRA
jgi:hypothetical protein